MTGGAPPGGERVGAEVLSRGPAGIMQAILDRDPAGIREGDPLPLGWHWFYFKQPLRASSLGVDGHEHRGAFMPDMDLPRRMWAGGTLRLLGPLRIGEWAELRSRVAGVEEKRGKSGRLVFVTVGQTVLQGGRACVEEEQVIVYRGAESGSAAGIGSSGTDAVRDAEAPATLWRETFLPTTVTLFQFSALTRNAHRIHYDHPYATEVEGCPGLLVHGPLTALLLLDAATRHGTGPVTRFRYRALAPLFGPAGQGGVERPGQRKTRIPRIGARRARGRGPWTRRDCGDAGLGPLLASTWQATFSPMLAASRASAPDP